MRSLKKKFFQTLEKECQKIEIPLLAGYTATDEIDWQTIKDYLEENEVYATQMPVEAFIADVFNSLLNELGGATKIDTYHESVGYICERSIVYYLISTCHIPNADWILGWIDFFIKDGGGHFEEVSFVPFEYLIKPYFDDTADIKTGVFDLFYILKNQWEKLGHLDITERRVNELLESL